MAMKRPTSRAKTADGLLAEIERLITAEPLRYDQHDVLWIEEEKDHRNSYRYNVTAVADNIPHCGTIGCVGGWVTALKTKRPSRVINPLLAAQRILGLTTTQADELFDAPAAGPGRQTPAHAARGVQHIRRFRAKHRAQLRAKKV